MARIATRKWLSRGIVLLLAAALVAGGFWLHGWVKPSRIRQQLIEQLQAQFPGAEVEVGSARLRILGGISVSDLKLSRRDDPARKPLLYVPSAVIYHDKEQLNQGRLVVRKVELHKPIIRLERDAAGRWNFEGIARPGPEGSGAAPMLVVNRGSVVYIDHRAGGQPLVELREADLVVVNDPKAILTIQAKVKQSPAGPIAFQGKAERATGNWAGTFEFPGLQVGPELIRIASHAAPESAEHISAIQASGTAKLAVNWINGPVHAIAHDLQIELTKGRFQHPRLPLLFDDIALKGRCRNGHVTIEKASARTGPAEVSLSLEMLAEAERPHLPAGTASISAERDPIDAIEERLARLDLTVNHLVLGPELLRRMPPKLQKAQEMFAPDGSISLSYELNRSGGHWRKRCVVRPEGLSATYRDFRFPLTNIRGTLEQVLCDTSPDQLTVDLKAEAAGRLVTFTGAVTGERPELDVRLDVRGEGLTLDDDKLIAALPEPYPQLMRRLHMAGTFDVDVQIRHTAETRRDYGPAEFANTFGIALRGARLFYDDFPYPLDEVTGNIVIYTQPPRPTRLPPVPGVPVATGTAAPNVGLILFRNLKAKHNGATMLLEGRKEPVIGGTALTMLVRGESVPLDEDFAKALTALRLGHIWDTFAPRGRMNCVVQARVFERAGAAIDGSFNPADDLELNLAFAGPALQPRFFSYLFTDVAGRIAYKKGQVHLSDFQARHGSSSVRLPEAEVLVRPSGGYWADLQGLSVAPLTIDADFLRALPRGLRQTCEGLELRGPMMLETRRLVVDDQGASPTPRNLPDAQPARSVRGYSPESDFGRERPENLPYPAPQSANPVIYWDGKLTLSGAAMNTGIPWEEIHGVFACRGRYEGEQMGRVLANLELQRATILKLPFADVHARFDVDPRQPDVVRIPELKGSLYGGEVGGEAQLVTQGPLQYKLKLNASRLRLDELARHQRLGKAQLEGLATAQLYLQNPVDPRTGRAVLEGGGTIDVPNGKLLNLPLILDLLKFIKGKIPDETAFEEAHALFRIRGERVVFGQLDLIGNAVSLGGEGEMNLDGSDLKLEFYTVWSRMNSLLPEPLTELTALLSKQFFKFIVRGRAGGPFEIKKEPVPLVVEPIKRVMARMKKKESGIKGQGSGVRSQEPGVR